MNHSPPSPLLESAMQSTNTWNSDSFATHPHYYPPFDNGGIGYGQLTEPPRILSDPFLVETPNVSWFPHTYFPPASHLQGSSIPSAFLPPIHPAETFDPSWFEESAGSSLPPSGYLLHGLDTFQPAPFSTASSSETISSAVSPITPARRVQNGRKSEAERIELLQNDEYVASFTEARVKCKKCRKSIKLDTRDGARFYLGFWLRHKRRCKGVEK